jgi:hypothetical protein
MYVPNTAASQLGKLRGQRKADCDVPLELHYTAISLTLTPGAAFEITFTLIVQPEANVPCRLHRYVMCIQRAGFLFAGRCLSRERMQCVFFRIKCILVTIKGPIVMYAHVGSHERIHRSGTTDRHGVVHCSFQGRGLFSRA